MRNVYGLLAVLLVGIFVVGALPLPQVEASALQSRAAAPSAGCRAMNDPALDEESNGNSIGPLQFFEAETLILSVSTSGGSAGAWLSVGGTLVDFLSPIPGTLQYTFAADTLAAVEWYANGWYVMWNVSCPSGTEPPTPPTELPASVPGCTEVDFPAAAVVGMFMNSTRAYWAPALDKRTDISFEAGKTAWVFGVDSSRQFYKVLLSCDFLWVPVHTMAPNSDHVWYGAPLPTNVVS